MQNAGKICENPNCDADGDCVHHFLKQSTHPELRYDPRNGMCSCGSCHSEIERRIRQGEDFTELYPKDRWFALLEKVENDRYSNKV